MKNQTQAPSTDVEALLDIATWSESRPAWQRQALRYLVRQDELTPDQIEELFVLSRDLGVASAPLTALDVRSPKSQSSVVTLKAVRNPEDVNALAPDQTLSFEKKGLTIIYGDNGAGKSGYARVLKHACRARIDSRTQPVMPNVYKQAPGIPRAQLEYAVNGQNRQTQWQLDQPSPPELSAVSVFDSRTAAVHVDGTNEVAYIPTSLDLLQRLAKIADAIKEKARQAKDDIEAQTPIALKNPPINHETQTAKAVLALKQDTDFKRYFERSGEGRISRSAAGSERRSGENGASPGSRESGTRTLFDHGPIALWICKGCMPRGCKGSPRRGWVGANGC